MFSLHKPTIESCTLLFCSTFLVGCFRGLFSEAPRYLATEYTVESPRIVAIRGNPVEMVSGTPSQIEALLLAPQGSVVEEWQIEVCGLNTEMPTQTIIRDLLCFEKEESVTTLYTGASLPATVPIPPFPAIETCYGWHRGPQGEGAMGDSGLQDTGWTEEGYYDSPCAHELPLRFTAIVDGKPVYAAAFTSWYESEPFYLRHDVTLSDVGIKLAAPATASAGDVLPLQIDLATDASYMTFHWYIDAGTLLDTGITAAHTTQQRSDDQLYTTVQSNNRLLIPEDYEGTLRIWVVVHEPWAHDLDMTWISHSIEVSR